MNPINPDSLPSHFWYGLFERCGDSSVGRFAYRNRQAEYGISQADFVNEYAEEAVQDARAHFAHQSPEQQRRLIEMIAMDYREEAARLIAHAEELTPLAPISTANAARPV